MENIAVELEKIVNSFFDSYSNISESISSKKISDDKWSLKEIVGHLVDSASNNHQRFIRLQIETVIIFPDYHYSWIDIEKFNDMKFIDIL